MDNDELKRQFLAIESYEEFDRRREEFKDFVWDREAGAHFTNLLKKVGVQIGIQSPDDPRHIDYF